MQHKKNNMYIYRYFYLNKEKNIFSNITQLPFDTIEEYLNYIKDNSLSTRSYNSEYLERRFRTEKQMYEAFRKKGGQPKIKHPYYFTLGNCHEWFYGKKNCFGSLAFSLDMFELSALSFTYGDSVPTFMTEFADGKEYRGKVYTYEEILDLINRKGMPNEWNTYEEFGPENYIEVQVWTDEFISFDTSEKTKFNDISVSELVSGIVLANPQISNAAISQKSVDYFIDKCKNHRLWHWFTELLSQTKATQFKNDVVHGLSHAYKCAILAFITASELQMNSADFKTLVYGALFHDVGRNFYDEGKSHGKIGAEKIEDYLRSEDEVHLEMLKEAIEKHDEKTVNTENIFLTLLRDIDSLEYMRLGIGIFDTGYLKTYITKTLIRAAMELNIYMYIDDDFINKIIGGEI